MLVQELVNKALEMHCDFRKFKYFPLDPNYVTEGIKEQQSYKEAEHKIRSRDHFLDC